MQPQTPMPQAHAAVAQGDCLFWPDDDYGMVGYESAQPMFVHMEMQFEPEHAQRTQQHPYPAARAASSMFSML